MTARTRILAPKPGIYPGVPFADYLKWDAISRSDLECASRSLAHLRHRLDAEPEEPTAAMIVGQALHHDLLDTDVDANFILTAPINEKSGESYGRGTAKWCEFADENPGKLILSRLERENVDAMVLAARRHPVFMALAGKSESEVSAVWREKETGVLCKCRFDVLAKGYGFVDVKSCEDASPGAFGRTAQNYGYFFQLAHYADAYQTLCGEWADPYIFAIEKDAPHLCCNYIVQRDALGPAINDRRRLLIQVAKAMKTNQWPGYPEEADLFPPEWVFRQDRFEGEIK